MSASPLSLQFSDPCSRSSLNTEVLFFGFDLKIPGGNSLFRDGAGKLPRSAVANFVEQSKYSSENVHERNMRGVQFCKRAILHFSPCTWESKGAKREFVIEPLDVQETVILSSEVTLEGDDNSDKEITFDSCGSRQPERSFGRRAPILLAGSGALSSLICLCFGKARADEWSYGDPSGVAKWEGLCSAGPKQSPIDIALSRTNSRESLGELQFEYNSASPTILNTGHGTMQVSFAQGNNFLKIGDRKLELLQFHFHAPSEHAFDGDRYAMEAHLVHRDVNSKKLAVVGVMMDASKYSIPNKCLGESLAYAPAQHGQSVDVESMSFSPSLLLPPVNKRGKNVSREYVHYVGSLSTPPCSEDVDWFVLDTPLEISTSQVIDFMKYVGDGHSLAMNSRPLQPLGDRVVSKGP